LLWLLASGALLHGWILAQQLDGSPLALVPLVDAELYWDWAGSLAAGHLQGDTPFSSAPLYPHFLGLLRWLGAGLTTVYLLQLIMHLCTATLVWWIGCRRFDGRTGFFAAGAWLLAQGPAYANLRVLAGPLQTLLMAVTLAVLVSFSAKPLSRTAAAAGVLTGLLALAWPPAQALVIGFALWIALRPGRNLRHALTFFLWSVLTISPATVHNLRASGEFIPISAHGGITLYHGNNPSADGTYSPLGVSGEKRVQERDAYDQAAAALGRTDIGWKDVDSHFSGLAVSWWFAHPGQALGVMLRKGWLFMTSTVHGEMNVPLLEKQDGSASRLYWAFLPESLLVLPALVAAALLLARRGSQHVPEAAIVFLALGVCLAFFYSPRYRLPALPVMAILAAWMGTSLYDSLRNGRTSWSLVWPLVVGGAGAIMNPWLGFESLDTYRADYELRVGRAYSVLGETELARARWINARDLGHPQAELELARLGLQRDPAAGLATLRLLAEQRPDDSSVQSALGIALAQEGQPDEALKYFREAAQLDRNNVDAEMGIGGCLVQLGQPQQALDHFERVLQLDKNAPDVHFNRGVALENLLMPAEARRAYEAELERDSLHASARGALVSLLQRTGEHAQAVMHAQIMLANEPGHAGAQLVLSWILATSPDESLHDGPEALRLARAAAERMGEDSPDVLDTLAAALARCGQWEEAQQTQARALAMLPQYAGGLKVEAMQLRQELYLKQQAYKEPR